MPPPVRGSAQARVAGPAAPPVRARFGASSAPSPALCCPFGNCASTSAQCTASGLPAGAPAPATTSARGSDPANQEYDQRDDQDGAQDSATNIHSALLEF